jgi:hypothetical protein
MHEGVQAPGREREREREREKKTRKVGGANHACCSTTHNLFLFSTLPEHFCNQNLVYTSPDKQIDCILWSGGGQGC